MMATPCGPRAVPTGGAGVACPAGIWILTTASTFFLAMGIPLENARGRTPFPPRPGGAGVRRDRQVWPEAHAPCQSAVGPEGRTGGSELGDLAELELDPRLSTGDVDQHLEL